MKRLNIAFVLEDITFCPLISHVFDHGHEVLVVSKNREITLFCENELISFSHELESNQYDVVISEQFDKQYLYLSRYVLTPHVSAGTFKAPTETKHVFAYWSIHSPDCATFSSDFVEPNLMNQTCSKLILELARQGNLESCLHSVNEDAITIPIPSKPSLYFSLSRLLKRYYGEDNCLYQSKNCLLFGTLDGDYDATPCDEDELNHDTMLLIAPENVSNDYVTRPDALCRISYLPNQQVSIKITYRKSKYTHFLEHLIKMNKAVLSGEDVSCVDILTRAEKEMLKQNTSPPITQEPMCSIVDKFDEIVLNYAQKTAVIMGDEHWSYEKLNKTASLIAYHLKNKKLQKESPVIIALDRSPLAIAGILGVLKSGLCYVPLDPAYPRERNMNIIRDTQAQFYLSTKQDGLLFDFDHDCMELIDVSSIIHDEHKVTLEKMPHIDASCLAYVIYTSGSTGAPKGVMIEHGNVVNLVVGETKTCQLDSSSIILNVASLGFDAAGWDIYGALLNGATLVIASKEIHASPDTLHQFIKDHQVSFATLTPAVLALMPREPIPSLKVLVVMGDVCPQDVIDFWGKNTILFNGYGPTEATIGATMSQYKPGKSMSCIGKPLHNYQIHILDTYLNPMPNEFQGEIYLSGRGIARGYFNQAELTQSRFIEHQFSGEVESQRIYKTGDLGYCNKDGEIIFVGRADHQVKIRGIRLELREVEIIIEQHDEIEQSLVMAMGEGANKHLIAYVKPKTTHKQIDKTQLILRVRSRLQEHLHPSVVPQAIMLVTEFTLNANGKIDRNKLPEPIYMMESKSDYSQPVSYQEQQITKIIEHLLQINPISVTQNIFELGVHSLIAAQIVARINEFFSIRLSTKDVFEHPTIRQLAALEALYQETEKIDWSMPILTERKGPLTPAQQRLWFLHQLDSSNTSYNLPFAIELHGHLNVPALKKSWQLLINNHESFRVIFGQHQGVAFQQALNQVDGDLTIIDINTEELDDALSQLCKCHFDISRKPPFIANLFKISDNYHVFAFIKHNIITDAWSEGVLIKELADNYSRIVEGEPLLAVSEQIPQIIDAAQAIRHSQQAHDLGQTLSYWEKKLEAHELLDFPSDYARPLHVKGKGYRYQYQFNNIDWQSIKLMAQESQMTTFMFLAAALNVFLAKYSNQTDIMFGTATAGRGCSAFEKISGFFVNTLPLRTVFSPDNSIKEIVLKTRETCIDAYQHDQADFEKIVEFSKAERFLNKNPLFQMMLVLQNADEMGLPDFKNLSVKKKMVQTYTSMFDLVWNFFEDGGKLGVELDYSTELFSFETVKRYVSSFEYLLGMFFQYWDRPLKELVLIHPEEQALLSTFSKGPSMPLSSRSVIDVIEAQVRQHPDSPALRNGANQLSYLELWQQVSALSNGIHAYLSEHELTIHNRHIGVLLDRNEDLIITILAILKSGNTYIPIDPDYPKERIDYMIDNADLDLIISDKNIDNTCACSVAQLRSRDNKQFYESNIAENAYILYTSGSTGNPKGVMVTHQNLINLCTDMVMRMAIASTDSFLSITTISFDIFGLELFCPLMAGAELIICHQDTARNPVALVNYLNEVQPKFMQATPTMWSMIADHIHVKGKFTILTGGEALPVTLRQKLAACATRLINVYGPTETTIWSTAADLSETDKLHIGKPINNTNCYILDEYQNPVPIGVWGELYIGGLGVSQGYWRNEALTKKAFLTINGERLYKTGDCVQWDIDGNIVFGGRKDSQIKIRGHRLELGEVEAAIMSYPMIKQALVKLQHTEIGDHIVAYVIKNEDTGSIVVDKLRQFLEDKIPAYAIPTIVMDIDAIPLTPNKKIDWKRLPKPDNMHAHAHVRYVEPQNETEYALQEIWQSVMKIKGLSTVENFFNLGGNSLHIPEIISKIDQQFSIKITIRTFILNSTIRDLAELLSLKLRT